jgi:small subunit ribosomal protein S5
MVSVEKRTVSKVVFINRSSRAGKGGPHFSFGVLVVVGDGCGRVGLGWGKAKEVASALYKAEVDAIGQMADVSLDGRTIAHEAAGFFCGAKVSCDLPGKARE